MNKFKNRIKYYLIGFLMGIVAVAFFFGQRGCTWLPGNRVKAVIAENNIIVGDSILEVLNCLADDSQPIFDLLNTDGDVDFGQSQTRTEPKIYKIDGANDLSVYFKLFKDQNDHNYSEIIEITSPKLDCQVSVPNRHKQPLLLPRKLIMQIIEAHKFTYYPIIDCQTTCYDIDSDSLKTIHRKATFIETPDIPGLINKVYNLTVNYYGSDYVIQYEIGENRTRIKNIKLVDTNRPDLCECEEK